MHPVLLLLPVFFFDRVFRYFQCLSSSFSKNITLIVPSTKLNHCLAGPSPSFSFPVPSNHLLYHQFFFPPPHRNKPLSFPFNGLQFKTFFFPHFPLAASDREKKVKNDVLYFTISQKSISLPVHISQIFFFLDNWRKKLKICSD